MKYEITFREDNLYRVTVEAESREKAIEKAYEVNEPQLLDRDLETVWIDVEDYI